MLEQPENACQVIASTPLPMCISFMFVQPEKVFDWIVSIPSGITTLCSPVQPWNAYSPIETIWLLKKIILEKEKYQAYRIVIFIKIIIIIFN